MVDNAVKVALTLIAHEVKLLHEGIGHTVTCELKTGVILSMDKQRDRCFPRFALRVM